MGGLEGPSGEERLLDKGQSILGSGVVPLLVPFPLTDLRKWGVSSDVGVSISWAALGVQGAGFSQNWGWSETGASSVGF